MNEDFQDYGLSDEEEYQRQFPEQFEPYQYQSALSGPFAGQVMIAYIVIFMILFLGILSLWTWFINWIFGV